jgi:S1-C subfamily serine protease
MNENSLSRWGGWWGKQKRLRSILRGAAPFTFGMLAVFVALLLYHTVVPPPPQLTTLQINDTVAQVLASATPPPAFSTRVYQIIRPSLVFIQTQSPGEGSEAKNSLGSGVVVDIQGDILTSLHVVADATDIQVIFADGTQSGATVIATQPENDIAVLSADQPPGLIVPAILGNPNAMQVGDEVYAVGNPFGLYSSMSAGVISGMDRTFQPSNRDEELKGLIQIDAAVNPGNSGGPLLNRNGEVIAIVTGIMNPTDQSFFVGIGFAVPITVAGRAAGLPPY